MELDEQDVFLKELIEVVPKLKSKEAQDALFSMLRKDLGIDARDDLLFVKENDFLQSPFSKIHARKILKVWNEKLQPTNTKNNISEGAQPAKSPDAKTTQASKTPTTKADEDNGPKRNFRDEIGTQHNAPVDNRKYENTYGGDHTETNYNAAVDQSQHNTTYGHHTQVGGTRNTKTHENHIGDVKGKNVHFGVGSIYNKESSSNNTEIFDSTFNQSQVNTGKGNVNTTYEMKRKANALKQEAKRRKQEAQAMKKKR